jgi:hypothetical protein
MTITTRFAAWRQRIHTTLATIMAATLTVDTRPAAMTMAAAKPDLDLPAVVVTIQRLDQAVIMGRQLPAQMIMIAPAAMIIIMAEDRHKSSSSN